MSNDGVVRSSKKIVRVTPTLSTDAYAQRDVFFTATEIPNAVIGKGGCSRLANMFILDQSDIADTDLIFVFSEGNTALGTLNATADISDANLEGLGIIGMAFYNGSESDTEIAIDNARIAQCVMGPPNAETSYPFNGGMFLQAASDSTSVYVQAILRSATTPTYAADDLDLIFHIER
tara:strand:- start:2942 stop:3472 length:531 start_codon:yes stop_codon:yes gene_type:complete